MCPSTQSQATIQTGLEDRLPFDTPAYGQALSHLGDPVTAPGAPWPVIVRPIPGSSRYDAMGPWPYGSPLSQAGAAALIPALKSQGLVSLNAMIKPGCPLDDQRLAAYGVQVARLKDHFVYQRGAALPQWSKKTRYNLAAARREWRVQPFALIDHWRQLAAYHAELALRRGFSRITNVPADYFRSLAQIPDIIALGAFDAGNLSAALIVARYTGEIHFTIIAGNAQAYARRAFYALYQDAIQRWSADHDLYMGSAPAAANQGGLARFKNRFATHRVPIFMLRAILDPEAYAALASQRGQPGYFPAYRTPFE